MIVSIYFNAGKDKDNGRYTKKYFIGILNSNWCNFKTSLFNKKVFIYRTPYRKSYGSDLVMSNLIGWNETNGFVELQFSVTIFSKSIVKFG